MIALTRDPKATSEAIELAGGRTLISKLASNGMNVEMDGIHLFGTRLVVLCFI